MSVDAELLFYQLLSAALPGVTVTDAPDTNAVNNLPVLVYQAATGSRVANADREAGQTWILALSVLAGSKVEAKDLALGVSDAVDELYRFGAGVAGVGYITYADETSLFARAPQTALQADDVVQYNAVFTVIVRPY